MAIDLPPVMPPELATKEQVQMELAGSPAAIKASAAGTEMRVYGNKYLSDAEVTSIVSAAKTPSEAIISLTRRYYETGHLLMKVRYFRALDSIVVFVDQLSLAELKGDSRATAHFAGLVGDADLSIAEFDRARVLADLQASRGGVEYSISYEERADKQVAMVFTQNKLANYDATEIFAEANNKGSRFLGRYFGQVGVKHKTEDGTQIAGVYQTAFADLGESRDGDELNQLSFNIDHPFTFGLYGLDISKTEYSRDPKVTTTSSGALCLGSTPVLGDVLSAIPGLLEGDCLAPGETVTTRVELDADILQVGLRGEQVLYSTPWERITLNQKLQHIDSSVERTDTGATLMDEVYQTAEIGAKYIKTSYDTPETSPSRLTLGVSLKAGFGSGGTLDDYAAYKQAFFAQNPGAAFAPDVVAQARTAEFFAIEPTANYQLRVGENSVLSFNAKAQLADEQVPQQQQFVLGGMTSLSAYLPGVLVGDEGYFIDAQLERNYLMGGFKLTPRVFAEYGGAWYQNARSPNGDEQTIADAGVGLKVEYGKSLYSELVAATPLMDDVADEDRLETLEADFYWRVRVSF